MATTARILSIIPITHDVLEIILEKPKGIQFRPGQAADVSINKPGWERQLRPFTFTSLPDEAQIALTIKTYPGRHGVTEQLLQLKAGDELLIGAVFGDIAYKGEGLFVAGGAGITPFLAILKQLEKENKLGNNKLLFANKSRADIIHEKKLRELLGERFINVLSDEEAPGYEHGFITAELLQHNSDHNSYYYLCGPPPMMHALQQHLHTLGVPEERIVQEGF